MIFTIGKKTYNYDEINEVVTVINDNLSNIFKNYFKKLYKNSAKFIYK